MTLDAAWDEIRAAEEAMALPEGERDAYLDAVCPTDEAKAELRDLLRRAEEEDLRLVSLAVIDPEEGELYPGLVVGDYLLEAELGEGGMGRVFRATHRTILKPFAIKFVRTAAGRDEAVLSASLRHPGIVQVSNLIRHDAYIGIVSEYVAGVTRRELIDQRAAGEAGTGGDGPKDPAAAGGAAGGRAAGGTRGGAGLRAWFERCAEIVACVAEALEFAHRNQIVHCDVKPSNILLDPDHGPRLADFGVSRYLGGDLRVAEQRQGLTPEYAAPEQLRRDARGADEVDRRCDVFSLGVVLYELLSLSSPFRRATREETLRAVSDEPPAALRKPGRGVPRDLETICFKALEKSRELRYPSAAHMAADLRCWLAGDPVLARPPGPARRVAGWARRRRTPRLFLGAGLLGATMLLAGWRVRALERRAMGRITLRLVGPVAQASPIHASYRRFDPVSRTFGVPEPFADWPVSDVLLEPGVYRVVVVDAAGMFSEFDEIISAGRLVGRDLHLVRDESTVDGMVYFPPGEYRATYLSPADHVQAVDADAVVRTIRLDAFFIDACEVSNAEYAAFVAATRRTNWPSYWENDGTVPEGLADRPVVQLTRDDMQAYAVWAGKRLPTLEEWMAAAQAPRGVDLPWLNVEHPPQGVPEGMKPAYDAVVATQTSAPRVWNEAYADYTVGVRRSDADQTPRGVLHMFGNVREMTGSFAERDHTVTSLIVGAFWAADPELCTLKDVSSLPIYGKMMSIGFRCARSASVKETGADAGEHEKESDHGEVQR